MFKSFICVFLFASLSMAQTDTPTIEVVSLVKASWTDSNTISMTFDVIDHHKIYKESLFIKPKLGDDIEFKNLQISPVETFFDKYSNVSKEGVKGRFTVIAEVYAKKDIKAEAFPILLGYQACSDEYCLFPQEFEFSVPIFIENSSMNIKRMMSESLFLAIIFVFFAGFLTSFTPCIFPMIPLTLAVLVPRRQKLTFSQKLYRSISYVLGIAVTYSLLGVFAASSGMMFGSLLGNKWVALVIGIIFILFALSMLGFFEIKTPNFLAGSKALNSSNTFFYGLAAGVIAGPCVGPVLLSILTFISQTGDMMTGFLLMMSFALGMGLIFILLGTAGDLVQIMPKSGSWLNVIKYIFALAMVGLAFYYVWPVLSVSEFVQFCGATIILISLFYLYFFEKKFFAPLSQKAKVFLYLAIVFGGVVILSTGAFSQKINSKWSSSYYEHGWVAYDENTIDAVLKNGKPTVIDFYADWCLSCKELKKITFSDSQVILKGQEFNLVLLDATQSSDLVEKLKKEHNILGLPTLLFYNSKGEKISSLTLTGFENAENFLLRLQKAQQQ
jgi:thioredoxin:protein disulfide reductase